MTKRHAFVPVVDGGLESRVVPSTATAGAVAHVAQTAGSGGGGGGGGIDTTIARVVAPAGVSQRAITFTSRAFAQVLNGRHHGWDGLNQIMARFEHTGNVARLEADLTRLAHHIPYGARDLLPVWQQTITTANLSSTVRDPNGTVRDQLKQDLMTYLSDNVGKDLNLVKSHGHYATDGLLTYNGRV